MYMQLSILSQTQTNPSVTPFPNSSPLCSKARKEPGNGTTLMWITFSVYCAILEVIYTLSVKGSGNETNCMLLQLISIVLLQHS